MTQDGKDAKQDKEETEKLDLAQVNCYTFHPLILMINDLQLSVQNMNAY